MTSSTVFSGASDLSRVLVLLPSAQDRAELAKLADQGFDFAYIEDSSWRSYEASLQTFDAVEYVGRCTEMAHREGAKAIFYSDDLANFVAAVVARDVGLAGPSVDSMVLANHKFYCREAESNPIRFQGFALERDEWRNALSFPSQVKPTSLYFSLLQASVKSESELVSAVEKLRAGVPHWERPFRDLFRHFGNHERFPMAGTPMFLAEEFVDGASQHAVEGWSDSVGRPSVWAVSDNNYFPGSGAALDNNSVPSRLSSDGISAVSEAATNMVTRAGVKNGFWNVELWIRPDGRVHITELNGRMCASMTPLYRRVYGMSQYSAALKVALGFGVDLNAEMPARPNGVGGMFTISTRQQGYVRDILRLNELPEIAKWNGVVKTALMFAPETLISWRQTGGRSCLARAWVVGRNYPEIVAIAADIRRRVLKESIPTPDATFLT